MAVNRKGSRRVVVDGVAYRWSFPRRPDQSQDDGWPGVGVTVWRADGSGAMLLLAFPQRFHPSGPVGPDPPRPVLPSDVAAGVRAALAAGWAADRPGAPFVLRAAEPG